MCEFKAGFEGDYRIARYCSVVFFFFSLGFVLVCYFIYFPSFIYHDLERRDRLKAGVYLSCESKLFMYASIN